MARRNRLVNTWGGACRLGKLLSSYDIPYSAVNKFLNRFTALFTAVSEPLRIHCLLYLARLQTSVYTMRVYLLESRLCSLRQVIAVEDFLVLDTFARETTKFTVKDAMTKICSQAGLNGSEQDYD